MRRFEHSECRRVDLRQLKHIEPCMTVPQGGVQSLCSPIARPDEGRAIVLLEGIEVTPLSDLDRVRRVSREHVGIQIGVGREIAPYARECCAVSATALRTSLSVR